MVDKTTSVCRVCLMEGDKNISLYETYNSSKYIDLIKEYTALEIIKNENLPSVICDVCSSELMTVISFVNKCRASNEKLQEALDQNIPFYELDSKDNINFLCSVTIKEEKEGDYDNYSDNSYQDEPAEEKKKKDNFRKVKKLKSKVSYTCDTCGVKTVSKSALISHNRVHTGERPYACTECNKCFSQSSTLREHIGRVHMRTVQLAKKSCICDFCGKQCYRKNELRVHLRTHTKEKPYKCELCPESFSQQSTLIQHIRRHKGEKPYSCHICGRCFVSQSGLRSHMLVHTTDKNYKCHICEKLLKSNGALQKHLLGHTDAKPNICDKCGVAFAQKGNLKHHILAKHSERSGTCEICKKVCSDVSLHMRFHTGEKPFKCGTCGKAFSRNCHLTLHMKRHQEPNKFACSERECDVAFPTQCQLDFHVLKIHMKYFPFVCEGCSKGFYRLTDMNKHKNSSKCKDLVKIPNDTKLAENPVS